MSYFLIRGLAQYFAASVMERRERRFSYTPQYDTQSKENKKPLSSADLSSWQTHMRWLLPFVQATNKKVVINNPKSHEQIVIDKDTRELPALTIKWMQRYNKQEIIDWMAEEEEKRNREKEEEQNALELQRMEEECGRARFGDSFISDNHISQYKKPNRQFYNENRKRNCIITMSLIGFYVIILVLLGILLYNSPMFADKRWDKEYEDFYSMMKDAENSPVTKIETPEGFRFDLS